MRFSHPQLRPLPLVLALQAIFVLPAYSQFNVAATVTDTVGKTLTGSNGTVQLDGTLTTSGATIAVTIANSATSSTLTNLGTIWQTSTTPGGSRAIKADANFTSTNNQITNGSVSNTTAIIRSDANDAIRLGRNVTLTNYGNIFSTGVVNTSCPNYMKTPVNKCGADLSAADGVAIENGRSNVAILNYGTITGPRHGIDGGDPVAAAADSDLIGVDRLIVTSTVF